VVSLDVCYETGLVHLASVLSAVRISIRTEIWLFTGPRCTRTRKTRSWGESKPPVLELDVPNPKHYVKTTVAVPLLAGSVLRIGAGPITDIGSQDGLNVQPSEIQGRQPAFRTSQQHQWFRRSCA
jgi:hypothetical protein